MALTGSTTRARRWLQNSPLGDRIFRGSTLLFAAVLLAMVVLIWLLLTKGAMLALAKFGLAFITSSTWDPVRNVYGALPAIYGTLVTSAIALIIAVPISLGTAVFLSELAPRWLRGPVSFLVELLAALPSVVYGLWGVFVLVPALRPVEVWLGEHFGFIPLFQGAPYGIGLLAAGLILAVMILPIITAISREVLTAVPASQKQAAYALGATRWEALRGPVLRYVRVGLLGAVILGLGRAMGETMAVTMVIGNRPEISASLFSPAYTMASVLANEFAEATDPLHTSALIEIALLLLALTVLVNIVARLLVWSVTKGMREAVRE